MFIIKKAKEIDASLGKTLADFEREIKNLDHFQVTTKKQQQLRDAVKVSKNEKEEKKKEKEKKKRGRR